MHTRAGRLTLVIVLLAVGLGAAFIAFTSEQQIQRLDGERQEREAVLERIGPAVSAVAAAQQAYVDYGRRDDELFTRVSALVDQITTDAAGLGAGGQSAEGAAHLEEFWVALSALAAADAEARRALAAGDTLAAADKLFASSRPHVTTLAERLRSFRAAEFSHNGAGRAAVRARAWIAIGGAGLIWLVGLVLLLRVPAAARASSAQEPAVQTPAEPPAAEMPATAAETPLDLPVLNADPLPAPAPPFIDLPATAALCSDIARLTDPAAMPVLLARAQRILDARGLIIWMGAGDELFAAAGSGFYDTAVIRRLPPIKRAATNATAAAWRTGELRTVAADALSLGAVVAPMFGPSGCIGVLAAEVRNGREADPAFRAVATVIASQLSTVLGAWPAPSSAGTRAESDRQAAAS